ncbi:DUF4232 domain-containing protein [Agromyces endophyticus]|uniref:DUF4232 domain-containing protein n=1 Tax=Agromyces sp. H17E-10 TaxID=2932244 RepID=UPI001FD55AF8|nr:DUF4232 domain-containing protein [Agromyces sp. H17E-10]UOQ87679.1 DUF4232 domain-containing protein [Agromyces sp. H17E-10]
MTHTRVTIAFGMLLAGALAFGGCAATPGSTGGPAASPTPEPSMSVSSGEGADDAAGDGADTDTEDTGVAARDQDPISDDELVAAHCVDEQFSLAVEPLPDESGAGSFGFSLVFTNVSDSPCTFDGTPGLIALDAGGAEVGKPALADAADSTLVVVQPGGVATAHVRAHQAGAYDCTMIDATGLRARLTSDGAGPGIDDAYAITVCDTVSTMTVAPLVAG